jgi:cysteine synthase A
VTNRFDNILQTIGRTPCVRLDKMAPSGVELYAKLESFNPMGSVKDRLALGVIEDAEKSGRLSPGQTVIEATSGNTGIGLAMVCARKGYPLVVTMAENFSVERRKLLRFLGAKVVLTPASEKGSGMLAKAEELAAEHGWFLCRQFENEANADAHSRTTAPEILEDFADTGLDYWVTGFGTGGTLKGVARVLKERSPETRVIVCEPDNSQLLGSGIPQPRSADGRVSGSHPNFRPHLMQGWSPDFVPKLTEDTLEMQLIDDLVPVSGADALRLSQELAQQEGILTGISGGATLAGALKVCESADAGSTVLCMLPDTGERYLTTTLFESVSADMNDEEKAISNSTPLCRFGAPPPPPPQPDESDEPDEEPATDTAVEIDADADDFVTRVLGDAEQPVVMFALEWCEFCWSVRKMFAHHGIPYRSVDLDSVEYQQGGRGGKIRAAVSARTGFQTIPQIFVGGEFIGGATDAFDAFRDGRLQGMLAEHGVEIDDGAAVDPYSFLPTWLHPR